ncbi:GDSL esterase/lipase At1g29670-like [Vicia villosa]|uniref:GDSL esterase/lipase At1g29670-like n=1 Tax=Vicia villosa TaxID=3911 RepID=UPI00273B3581|nr:GDSL esterase/lipase At1g29670-like [Vicia villosa]
MDCEKKAWLVLHLLLLTACYMQHCVAENSPQVPCFFIFGDDYSDNGNNNNLRTTAKANYSPYGIDFPNGPTGRTTNGETVADKIGKLLGLKNYIPPFANTTGSNILQGVNYASSSAGLLFTTGKMMGTNIDSEQQIANHKIVVDQIAIKLGGVINARKLLKKCVIYVETGSNDYLLNYLQPQLLSITGTLNAELFAQLLIDLYAVDGELMYQIGGRKFVAVGLGKIGCIPRIIASRNGSCDEELNKAASIFNQKLKALVDLFGIIHPDTKAIFINTTAITFNNSSGFTNFNASCCPIKPDGYCIPDSKPCQNINEHLFYDGIHPTSAANNIIASRSYDSANNTEIAYPFDIKRLAEFNIGSS